MTQTIAKCPKYNDNILVKMESTETKQVLKANLGLTMSKWLKTWYLLWFHTK